MTTRSLSKLNTTASKSYTTYRDQKIANSTTKPLDPRVTLGKKPDLIIEDAFVSNLDHPNPEGLCKYMKLFLYFKVKNVGKSDAVFDYSTAANGGIYNPPFASSVFTRYLTTSFSGQTTIVTESEPTILTGELETPGDYQGPTGMVQSFRINAGQTREVKIDLSDPMRSRLQQRVLMPGSITPGDYEIKIVADPDNVVDEIMEINNTKIVRFKIEEDYPPPEQYRLTLKSFWIGILNSDCEYITSSRSKDNGFPHGANIWVASAPNAAGEGEREVLSPGAFGITDKFENSFRIKIWEVERGKAPNVWEDAKEKIANIYVNARSEEYKPWLGRNQVAELFQGKTEISWAPAGAEEIMNERIGNPAQLAALRITEPYYYLLEFEVNEVPPRDRPQPPVP